MARRYPSPPSILTSPEGPADPPCGAGIRVRAAGKLTRGSPAFICGASKLVCPLIVPIRGDTILFFGTSALSCRGARFVCRIEHRICSRRVLLCLENDLIESLSVLTGEGKVLFVSATVSVCGTSLLIRDTSFLICQSQVFARTLRDLPARSIAQPAARFATCGLMRRKPRNELTGEKCQITLR